MATTPTSHLKPDLPTVEVDQTGNPTPHDYRRDKVTPYRPADKCVVFCLSCMLCRPADGHLDKMPCKGPARIGLRNDA